MGERGSALLEALIASALVAVIGAAVLGVLAELPAQAARWEEAAAARQRVRAIEVRLARIAAGARPIELQVDGARVRVPSIWPRRLGLFRPGAPGEVSPDAATFLSRVDGHRAVVLRSALGSGSSSVAFTTEPGCGTAAACGLRAGDLLLAVSREGACGLFRVSAAGERLDLAAIMEPAAAAFEPGSVLVPVVIDAMSFDPDEGALRRYDGYRSDSVMADGLQRGVFEPWPAAALGDGPFIGAGPLAFDVDQLSLEGVGLRLAARPVARTPPAPGAWLRWRAGRWP
ncbi:MAG TPA: hypothetical protein VMN81_02490 [Vicinamibacterales bacterium]|nr:hypothetical protein [Vicinamibacterales bacterium]